MLDNVDPGDLFGDRVLDLETRVHLEKVKVALRVDEELDRAFSRGGGGGKKKDQNPIGNEIYQLNSTRQPGRDGRLAHPSQHGSWRRGEGSGPPQ